MFGKSLVALSACQLGAIAVNDRAGAHAEGFDRRADRRAASRVRLLAD